MRGQQRRRPPGSSPAEKGLGVESLRHRREAEVQRKRDEAEVKLLIQTQTEQCNVLASRVAQNDAEITSLNHEIEVVTASSDAERMQLLLDVRKWERRLTEAQRVVSDKEAQLGGIRAYIDGLTRMRNQSRLCLAYYFLRKDMAPDNDITVEDVFDGKDTAAFSGLLGPKDPLRKGSKQEGGGEKAEEKSQEVTAEAAAYLRPSRTALEDALEELQQALGQEDNGDANGDA